MGLLDYYRRRNQDGTYEAICTRCFKTLGPTGDLAQLAGIEAEHFCTADIGKLEGRPEDNDSVRKREPFIQFTTPRRLLRKVQMSDLLLGLFSLVLCLYVLPSVIEAELIGPLGVWISCILFGDVVGCLFLALFLGMRKLGVLLYLVLTAAEAGLYVDGVLSARSLFWVVDMVPTLVVITLVSISFFGSDGGCTMGGERLSSGG